MTDMCRPKMSLARKIKLDRLLLLMIVKDMQPFSIVDDEGFKEFIAELEPSYTLPSRSTLSRSMLPSVYEDVAEKVRDLLKTDAEHVTLTTDTWTSCATQGYMSVTAHFVTKKWQMQSVLLECFQFSKSHTSENLRNELVRVVNDWGLERKVHTIVSDNAANIVRAINLTGFQHVSCVAHTINLVVQDALKKISPLHKKMKAIVEYFHRSTVAADKLNSYQKQMQPDKVPLKLIMDVVTRWNSTFFMMERLVKIQEPLEAAMGVLRSDLDRISSDEWTLISEMCNVLQPFAQITTELSAEKTVSASKVICY